MKISPSYLLLLLTVLVFSACDDDGPIGPSFEVPTTYSFQRDGNSSVSFSGQTTRIAMAEELSAGMLDFNQTELRLLEMFRNQTATGEDADPFMDPVLNTATKSISSKVAASEDFFSANTTGQAVIRQQFETWISKQTSEIFSNTTTLAAEGVAGQIADGSTTRYVNRQGLEFNQFLTKSLIGALMLDQTVNNYLSPAVLDAANNREENDAGILADGTNYTTMEHKWDEAFGYVYGAAPDPANANQTTGADDNFLNKYLGRVEGDSDFTGISQRIFDAFKTGRAAIVAGDYDERDRQAEQLREDLSMIIGIRAVYYLQQAKLGLEQAEPAYGTAFHDLSEGYGFIFSLQFTRQPNSRDPYFTNEEVNNMLSDLLDDGANGLWNVTPATLDALSNMIADRFDFTVEQAGS